MNSVDWMEDIGLFLCVNNAMLSVCFAWGGYEVLFVIV